MKGAQGSPRLLLRRLREVMAEPVNAQTRLDRIVVQIAANMVAEVCSVYVLRADTRLELYATEGLNREAVHLTTMRSDEGLVGLIARSAESLALADARQHPSFSYRPETGEEEYPSFLGVPILRGGNTLGVLVVQNKARRSYVDEEVEVLQTTAMLLAEMIASGELQSLAASADELATRRPLSLTGTPITDGIGLGHVVLHEPRIVVKRIVAEDIPHELRRLDVAITAVRASIDRLVKLGDQDFGDKDAGETRDILETFRAIANDRGWLRRLREAVSGGLTAEAAVERVQNDARAKMQRQTDPYIRERLHDLDDLANRLLHELVGRAFVADHGTLPDNAIIVARSMGPAALLDYDRSKLRGLVLEDAGALSHVAIVARSLGIPAVGNVSNIINLADGGDGIIVDGSTGDVHVRQTVDVENSYGEKARLRAKRQDQYRALRDEPCVTRDGVPVDLHMNAGLIVDLQHMAETGAVSIGLFRTEIQFMVANRFPRMREQEGLYRSILEAADGKPVTFRTLDIGSDKILPYMNKVEEENPALGWRAIRIGLDRPALLRSQLRAMLRAGGGRELRIMFPMISAVEEFAQAKGLVEQELAYLARYRHALPRDLKLGIMLEVPSLLWQLDEVCARVDFVSVGSNDLVQYLFAADRDNTRVATRFDTLSPPVLRALKMVADKMEAHGTPLTLCGEMGGKPLEAIVLVALGFHGLSMSPAAIGPVKAAVLATDLADLRRFVTDLLDRIDGGHSLREPLRAYAEMQGIPLS